MPFPREVQGLRLTVDEGALTVTTSPHAGVRLTRRPDGVGEVRLLFGRARRGPDVSVQPAAVGRTLDDRARLAGIDPNRWRVEVVRAIRECWPELEWVLLEPRSLAVAVGAFTHPLLAPVYREGRTPLDEIPRWAAPVLRASTPSDAARALCGARTNRRLTRVLAASFLGRDDVVDLGPLALAVCAADLVSLDELANVIVASTGADRPLLRLGSDDVAIARNGLRAWPDDRRAALLLDVAHHHDARRLATSMARLRWVLESAPRPLPTRLSDVDELCGRLIPVLAPPPPAARRRRPARTDAPPVEPAPGHPERRPGAEDHRWAGLLPRPDARPVGEAPPRRRPGAQGRVAPPTGPDTDDRRRADRWPIPEALLPVHDQVRNELRFCVPTTREELRWWSRQLSNCLDTFAAAAASGRSWLVGIRRDDVLIGCVEVCPRTRLVRQAQGPRQRPLPPAVYDVTMAMLRVHGVLRPGP